MLLQEDYAGLVSEFTATSQYSYHFFIMKNINTEAANTIQGISIIEMKHMELLSQAIIQLGGNPLFYSAYNHMPQYWSGSYVKYSTSPKQIILDDIDAEQKAILQYRKHLSIIRDPNIQKLLQRIILDEQYHIKLFTDAYNKI